MEISRVGICHHILEKNSRRCRPQTNNPDVKTWREALFCGHFGPIGVGAIFASILARKDLEAHYTTEETPLHHLPNEDFPHYQLLATIWPIVCFIVITSIIVHGSSVAVLTLGKRLNRMAITMSLRPTKKVMAVAGGCRDSRNSTVPPPPSPYTGGYNGTNRKTATRNYRHKSTSSRRSQEKEEP